MFKRTASLVALLGCLGCGGAAQESPTPRAPTTALAPAVPAGMAAPDLTPVAAPPDLILVGRIARPKLLLETLAGWLGLPFKIESVLPGDLAELGQALAWDAPLELAGVMDRRASNKAAPPLWVVSVGLASFDKALELAQARASSVSEVAPGVYRVTLPVDATCGLAASLGASPARLVCGQSWRDVEELLPFATRGLPTQDLGPEELELQVNAEPIRRTYDRDIGRLRAYAGLGLGMVSLDDPRFDRVLTDVAYGLADELKALAGELSTLRVSGRLDTNKKSFALRQTLTFHVPGGASASSFTAQVIGELGRRQTTPPEVFWELPAEGATGGYALWADPAKVGAVLKNLTELGDAYLEHEQVPQSVRRRARKILEAYATLSSSGAYVSGPPTAKPGQPGVLGWSVGASFERADKLSALLGELKALLLDKEFARVLADRLDLDPKLLPRMKTQVLAVKGFPARATAYEIELPRPLLEKLELLGGSARARAANAPVKSQAFTLIVVPDGEHSWIAHASEQKRALALLEGLRTSTAPKLGSVAALQPLKGSPAVWGGFWTIESFLPQLAALQRGDADLLARMPNHGRSPFLIRLNVSESAPSLTLALEGELPQGAFEDLASLLPDLAGGLLRSGAFR